MFLKLAYEEVTTVHVDIELGSQMLEMNVLKNDSNTGVWIQRVGPPFGSHLKFWLFSHHEVACIALISFSTKSRGLILVGRAQKTRNDPNQMANPPY